jgi:hypothetical protein
MLSEIETISAQMSHQGEKGRNNELVLGEFLRLHLPSRYSVSTGKVVAVGGLESAQMDLIIHDRLFTPALVDARAWSLVPVEAVQAVVSVKTTLKRSELADALDSLQSVRKLPRQAAVIVSGNATAHVPEAKVLRPRAYVFGFKSDWADAQGLIKAFVELSGGIPDDLRSNGVCALNQALVVRKAFTLDTIVFDKYALMHFFVYLLRSMDGRPRYLVDMSKYFTDEYGLA